MAVTEGNLVVVIVVCVYLWSVFAVVLQTFKNVESKMRLVGFLRRMLWMHWCVIISGYTKAYISTTITKYIQLTKLHNPVVEIVDGAKDCHFTTIHAHCYIQLSRRKAAVQVTEYHFVALIWRHGACKCKWEACKGWVNKNHMFASL